MCFVSSQHHTNWKHTAERWWLACMLLQGAAKHASQLRSCLHRPILLDWRVFQVFCKDEQQHAMLELAVGLRVGMLC